MLKRFLLMIALLTLNVSAQAFSLFPSFATAGNSTQAERATNTRLIAAILAHASSLNPKVLALALTAYNKLHARGYDPQQMLTIVDYSRPSTEPRLWVINLKNLQVPVQTLVAHGKNSGDNLPTAFSDNPASLKSSIGVYLTGDVYFGEHGYSLRLDGLENGFNDKAAARDIVVHAASYVSEQFARMHGRLGRSWGCMAVNPAIADNLIHEIKGGTVLFAYYPDRNWLRHSAYLQQA